MKFHEQNDNDDAAMTKKVLGLTDNFSKKKKRNCVTSA
jgi:hypothetical protein